MGIGFPVSCRASLGRASLPAARRTGDRTPENMDELQHDVAAETSRRPVIGIVGIEKCGGSVYNKPIDSFGSHSMRSISLGLSIDRWLWIAGI